MVDVVLYLEGERYLAYRVLRGVKNRFGSTNEIGMFEMQGEGMKEITNPSDILIAEKCETAARFSYSFSNGRDKTTFSRTSSTNKSNGIWFPKKNSKWSRLQ